MKTIRIFLIVAFVNAGAAAFFFVGRLTAKSERGLIECTADGNISISSITFRRTNKFLDSRLAEIFCGPDA